MLFFIIALLIGISLWFFLSQDNFNSEDEALNNMARATKEYPVPAILMITIASLIASSGLNMLYDIAIEAGSGDSKSFAIITAIVCFMAWNGSWHLCKKGGAGLFWASF